jgi:molecular chaperone GrpE
MSFFKKAVDALLGGDDAEKAEPKTDGAKADGAKGAGAKGGAARSQADALSELLHVIDDRLESIDEALEGGARVEQAIASLAPMLQFTAKTLEKSDRAREQGFLDLRAHLTMEIDRLGASLRLDAAKQASLDVFKAILPSLDDIDHVVEESDKEAKGVQSLVMVQKKMKEAFAKLGIDEIAIEERKTAFDPALHEGEPDAASSERSKGLAKGTIVQATRAGYRVGDVLIRSARVVVASGG